MNDRFRTLLLVEDEALIAMNQRMQLEKIGYAVHHVLTGEAAISYTLDPETRPDLVLMDIDLGKGIDGTQAAEQILAEIEIPIVFVSSHTEPEVVEKTEKITSYGYVVKNSGITVLDASIKMAFKLFEAKMQEERYKTDLLHSRDLMKYIIEHTRGAVAVHDRDLKYIYVSKQYLDQYNVKERDVIGKHHYEVFPDLPQKFRDAHQRALRGQVSKGEDDPYERQDGTITWTRWECRPWYETDDSIGGIIVYTEVLSHESAKRLKTRDTIDYLRSILRTTRDGFWVADMAGRLLDVNVAYCEMSGYSRQEFLQLSISDIDADERPQHVGDRIAETRSTGHALFHTHHRRKDGTTFDVEVSASFLGGYEDRLVVFIRDISRRKAAEHAAARALENQRILLDNIPTQVWYLTDTMTYGAVNKAHAQFFGVQKEDLSFKDMKEIFPAFVVEQCRQSNQEVFAIRTTVRSEEWVPDASGELRLLSIIKTPKLDENGEVEYVVCAADDITDWKKAEEDLRARERLLQTILDNSVDLIALIGLDGTINHVSKSAESLGYDLQTLLGTSYLPYLHPDDREPAAEALRAISEFAGHRSGQCRWRRANGEYVWIETNETVLRDATGNPQQLLVNARDITERKRAEEEIQHQLAEKRDRPQGSPPPHQEQHGPGGKSAHSTGRQRRMC